MNDSSEKKDNRSLIFKERREDRYWWYWDKDYVPPVYSFLDDNEWNIMKDWYRETDENKFIGESNIPIMCVIQGFVMGSNISNIVQLGHHSGYSTLLIGFMLRKMNFKNSFFSIDIDKKVCDFTQKWIEKAELAEFIHIECGDSGDPKFVPQVKQRFNGVGPELIFIDSSHQYDHTLQELNLWYDNLADGGFMLLHDTSDFASSAFDDTKRGGVKKAFQEWVQTKDDIEHININSRSYRDVRKNIYLDGCGLGIVQKVFKGGDLY
jgi:cephalosporin hydroxylase